MKKVFSYVELLLLVASGVFLLLVLYGADELFEKAVCISLIYLISKDALQWEENKSE